MSYRAEFKTFFESPSGISLLTWLQEQRTSEHALSEQYPEQARDKSQTAKAYGQVINYIETIMLGSVHNPYSSRRSDKTPSQELVAPSTGLGTSL